MSKKIISKLFPLIAGVSFILMLHACGENLVYQEPSDEDLSIRQLVNKYYKNSGFLIGATTGQSYLTDISYASLKQVFYKEFYLNSVQKEFNQASVYPVHNKEWFNGSYKHLFDLARKNKQVLSVDASLSPVCSEWIKNESSPMHSPENIADLMNHYVMNIAKEAEKNKDVVKWMTVIRDAVSRGHEGLGYDGTGVNTVYQAGEWFGPVAGVGYENPWTVLGMSDTTLTQINLNETRIPRYVFGAFRLTNLYAPGVKQLIAQSDDEMNDKVWNTVKQLVITLREKGFRIDGIDWTAKLDMNKGFGEDKLRKLSLLIDWCYQNNVEFHISGLEIKALDVNRWDTEDLEGLGKKENEVSAVMTPIAKLMTEKAGKGAKTLSYGIFDGRYEQGIGTYAALFDHEGGKRRMYVDMQKLLSPELSDN